MNPWLHHVAQLALGCRVLDHRARRPAPLKALLKMHLERDGWYCTTRFKVESRGTNDGQRGVLDLITWPPPHPDPRGPEHTPNPHISNRPPPVLVEIDKTRVYLKTRAKLASFAYPCSGRLVILTQADDSDECRGIDTIVCLGISSARVE